MDLSLPLRLPAMVLGCAVFLRQAPPTAPAVPPESEYPAAVLQLTGNRQPFTPSRLDVPYEFPLKRLVAAERGIHYGSAIKLDIQPLGGRLLLVDTAARGLLLKSAQMSGKDVIRVPEWVLFGPGLQTGIFRVLGRLSSGGFGMDPAVAELFQGKGFAWVDGIISTALFKPWLVRLDLRRNKLFLLPYQASEDNVRNEWESRLDHNWWIVKADVRGKLASLLLDSGTPRTYLAKDWILRNFGHPANRQRSAGTGNGPFHEAGVWDIVFAGVIPVKISCLYAESDQLPVVAGAALDGVLGFDALRVLSLELDYRAAKLYIRR